MSPYFFSCDDTPTLRIEWGVQYKGYRAIQRAPSESRARAWVDYANTHAVPAVLFSRTVTTSDWAEVTP